MTVFVKEGVHRGSSTAWVRYFEQNRDGLLPIDWDDDYVLSADEVQTILSSVQQFQLGESSEGKHLIEQAKRYVDRSGDHDYLVALRLFIAEENRHAHDLGRFLGQQNLPLTNSHWVDGIFRRLRRLATLEISIVVLLMAEIVAMLYYQALRDASQSTILRQICQQILHDEVYHLRFQTDTLKRIRYGRSVIVNFFTNCLQRVLFSGTLLVVWSQHRNVYRASGYSFKAFWVKNWLCFQQTFSEGGI